MLQTVSRRSWSGPDSRIAFFAPGRDPYGPTTHKKLTERTRSPHVFVFPLAPQGVLVKIPPRVLAPWCYFVNSRKSAAAPPKRAIAQQVGHHRRSATIATSTLVRPRTGPRKATPSRRPAEGERGYDQQQRQHEQIAQGGMMIERHAIEHVAEPQCRRTYREARRCGQRRRTVPPGFNRRVVLLRQRRGRLVLRHRRQRASPE